MEHTKGPWKKDRNMIEDSGGKLIATISYEQDGYVQANARLIAAAPTMDIAIRSMLVNIKLAIRMGANDAYLRGAIEVGEAALAKAEGKEAPCDH